jgi:transcription elongation factor GreA
MGQIAYYTEEGLQKLRDELKHLESVERPAITKAIVDARDKGDLSENAEYDAAREEQAHLEFKIGKLKSILADARVVDVTKLDLSKVSILSKVKIKNLKNNAEMTYTLVAENEADLKLGKISVDSPIGKGLMGKKLGEKIEITVPAGNIPFEIIDISI